MSWVPRGMSRAPGVCKRRPPETEFLREQNLRMGRISPVEPQPTETSPKFVEVERGEAGPLRLVWDMFRLTVVVAFWKLRLVCSNHGGQALRLRALGAGSGIGDWSNLTVVAAGVRDTLWLAGWRFVYPTAGRVHYDIPAGGDTAGWFRPFGCPGPLVDYEAVARAVRSTICELYGYWVLWGARQPCP